MASDVPVPTKAHISDTLQESDGDLGYHATVFPEAYAAEEHAAERVRHLPAEHVLGAGAGRPGRVRAHAAGEAAQALAERRRPLLRVLQTAQELRRGHQVALVTQGLRSGAGQVGARFSLLMAFHSSGTADMRAAD